MEAFVQYVVELTGSEDSEKFLNNRFYRTGLKNFLVFTVLLMLDVFFSLIVFKRFLRFSYINRITSVSETDSYKANWN